MFENLSERLERSFKLLKGQGKITEINVAETLKDVRRALLDADVNYSVAKQFTDTVKAKRAGSERDNGCKAERVDGEDCPRRVGTAYGRCGCRRESFRQSDSDFDVGSAGFR